MPTKGTSTSDSKIVRIVQTVHIDHNQTVEWSWYDVVERTIERTLDTEGNLVEEILVDEQVIETGMDLEEETISTDEDTDADQIAEEVFEDEEE